jgi:hypothetical protein
MDEPAGAIGCPYSADSTADTQAIPGEGFVSQEILYTSAPRGIKPGSGGFCTVQSTAGMAKNLVERLESLSGYRHHFASHGSGAPQNPVNYSHLHLTVVGRKYHVLSRICDAGLDYTQRTNKLAHHVVLEPREVRDARGGPAWVLSDNAFSAATWDGEVKALPGSRKKPRTDDCPAGKCRGWARAAKDAGWAGVLAKSASRTAAPISVVFAPGTDTLELVREALSLLPPEDRWNVTFSTYFTKLLPGVDCQWRFLIDGSPEATALRRDPHARMIDLCRQLGPPPNDEYVQRARAGLQQSLFGAP